jgi:hypothetical protein
MLLIFVPLFLPAPAAGGNDFGSLPEIPRPVEDEEQVFNLEYAFFNRDIGGNTTSSIYTEARYTRFPRDGRIRWNSVTIGTSDAAERRPLELMEGFSYRVGEEIVGESLYIDIPGEDLKHLVKTMVWDGMMIEMFELIRDDLYSLEPNAPRKVSMFEDFDVRMGDWGNLLMRDLILTWTGLSRKNGEICALIYYKSLSNPVSAAAGSGRSLYWGHVWISEVDGDIECLTLNEDVVLNMALGEPGGKIIDLQREVRFEKVD